MPGPTSTPSLPHILLIDDDPISREVLSMLLEMEGFPVSSAEHGQQAVAILSTSQPEVILMDTQMPGLSGIELVHALRSASPARLIAISGSEINASIREATDGFLLKPIEAAHLVTLLQSGNRNENNLSTVAAGSEAEPEPIDVVIDVVILDKLKAMMPAAAVTEIYTAVANDLTTRLNALQQAMNANDTPEVARIAHSIKGGCAMVGLSSAMQSAARLESSNLRETWPKEVLQLHNALKSLQSMLKETLL
ncbi:response regulator [Acidicapsa ligni]|uniref:response regulator n=1 Tax=Acidicapsa ligni TaxID=542300 RepID=UPI0021E08A69|nr:response regulator [Acidicapsa ligni]